MFPEERYGAFVLGGNRRTLSWTLLVGGIVYGWAAWAWADQSGLALWQLPVAIYLALPFLIGAAAVESGRGSRRLAATLGAAGIGLALVCFAVRASGIAAVELVPVYALVASVVVGIVSRRG